MLHTHCSVAMSVREETPVHGGARLSSKSHAVNSSRMVLPYKRLTEWSASGSPRQTLRPHADRCGSGLVKTTRLTAACISCDVHVPSTDELTSKVSRALCMLCPVSSRAETLMVHSSCGSDASRLALKTPRDGYKSNHRTRSSGRSLRQTLECEGDRSSAGSTRIQGSTMPLTPANCQVTASGRATETLQSASCKCNTFQMRLSGALNMSG
mmetsp:Transcript_26392/g.61612  ORF Transcript_26392/g.61612 Transcript_26392/m.61612 type:complete len:211 (+) Transcript_26392:695-1327(+)